MEMKGGRKRVILSGGCLNLHYSRGQASGMERTVVPKVSMHTSSVVSFLTFLSLVVVVLYFFLLVYYVSHWHVLLFTSTSLLPTYLILRNSVRKSVNSCLPLDGSKCLQSNDCCSSPCLSHSRKVVDLHFYNWSSFHWFPVWFGFILFNNCFFGNCLIFLMFFWLSDNFRISF